MISAFLKNKQKLLLVGVLLLAALLRLWQLNKVPVSLFGDELDVGYQAYSILRTGKDYSGNFMPIHFRSLDEWRTPLYLYSSVPTVALFGISPLGVRLPAAVFGILSVLVIYALTKELTGKSEMGLLAAILLAISPWHIQYSRAAFEVTEMIFFYLLGVYFFLRGLSSPKLLTLSVFCLGITPWVYNTSKLFLPLTIFVLLVIWKNNLPRIPKKNFLLAVIVFIIITVPYTFSTIFAGGTQRIQGISIFNDPTVEGQIGFDRSNDAKVRGGQQNIFDKLFHNKTTVYFKILTDNYFQSFSTQFLFMTGDSLNPRQSSGREFYKLEFFFLIIGLIFLATSSLDRKIKTFLILWLLLSPVPSAFTQGGGTHATRLILMLPVLIIFIAFGIYAAFLRIGKKFKVSFVVSTSGLIFLSFIFYQHDYWVHYPWRSERWWHAGYEEAIKSAVKEGENYNKVIISSANEPSLKFFLGWSMYPPDRFQEAYKLFISKKVSANSILKLGKYEFPPIGEGKGLYELGSILPDNSLYLATAKEIGLDLTKDPGRMPSDLILVKSIAYPSGAPAFYLLTKTK